jgi:DNA repair exonuclease SbcCD ATPase subunit
MNAPRICRFALAAALVACAGMGAGCFMRPGKDELSKLDESKKAAESAEKKLSELKQERMRLESDLQQKQAELKKSEDERDNIKQKTGK